MTDAEMAEEILDALKRRAERLICATEPRLGAKNRRIDFWTLSPHEGKGYKAVSYEIKVSRADFRRDSALKQREARLYSDELYYVAPKGRIPFDEIPDWAGLQEWNGKTFRCSVPAPMLSKSFPSWEFVSSLIRSSTEVRRDVQADVVDLRGQVYLLKAQVERLKAEGARGR